MLRWILECFAVAWRGVIATLDFVSLLEDEKPGSPRRISQTKVMAWGAMAVGALILLSVNLKGTELSFTETGVIGLLTIAAGLMKVVRDRRRDHDDVDDRYDRGGPDGD